MTETKTNSILETLHNYLQAIQQLHLSHKEEYSVLNLHPEINTVVGVLDSHLQARFDSHLSSPLLQVATEYPNGFHVDLQKEVKAQCAHNTVHQFLDTNVEIDTTLIKRLFFKYQLNQTWLSEFVSERRQDIQQIIEYLHELLIVLDMTFHLRGFAKTFGENN